MTAKTADLWRLLDRFGKGFQLVHRWPLPTEIRIERASLCYRPVEDAYKAQKWVDAPGIKLLTGFLTLADEPPAQIERYAKRWGTLGLCEQHGLSWGHPRSSNESDACRLATAEPLDSWRYFSKVFRSVLDEAERLKMSHQL